MHDKKLSGKKFKRLPKIDHLHDDESKEVTVLLQLCSGHLVQLRPLLTGLQILKTNII